MNPKITTNHSYMDAVVSILLNDIPCLQKRERVTTIYLKCFARKSLYTIVFHLELSVSTAYTKYTLT